MSEDWAPKGGVAASALLAVEQHCRKSETNKLSLSGLLSLQCIYMYVPISLSIYIYIYTLCVYIYIYIHVHIISQYISMPIIVYVTILYDMILSYEPFVCRSRKAGHAFTDTSFPISLGGRVTSVSR